MSQSIDTSVLNGLIIGRVDPKIYAFTTKTVPNYLKVGDTYRPVEIRLNEWRKHFPNLEKEFEGLAKVNEETFFRDYAVHDYLENQVRRKRLQKGIFKDIHYSKEFFEEATAEDIEDAINDIKNSFMANSSKYQYYQFEESRVAITHTYAREADYNPRPNQQETIDRFKNALQQRRTNLLMYAVMRFGKSFTSMCCAVEMNAKVVLIVSAKADVKGEWKKTVESHKKFDGFSFIDSNSLLRNRNIIQERLKAGEKVALFLTLQDLQGDEIKSKHKAVFERQIDLLIIDETHFGARATEYGKALRMTKQEEKNELKLNDKTIEDLESSTKALSAKVRLHLSGTPYRILMGSEFKEEDIIAFYQFSDIADDQASWDRKNLTEDDAKEWDNPYYGFPQMIRFALNPNEASRKKMEKLKKSGVTYAFSELLRPKYITKDAKTQLHTKFKHEEEVKALLGAIDGSQQDENLLSFLDYEKIRQGSMCRHIVCVLPYRTSCDALEQLIKNNAFKNLSSYEVINISGVDGKKHFKENEQVQEKIKQCEAEDKKTITLTVNRMLTGSTVPEWDTMLFLKDTASPQEYDQAVFRLQNQYIKVFKEPNGDTVKYNMKPQTLLVDFNPNRMLRMQEHKSQIYNVNTEENGNAKLEERIKKELEISPIVIMNKGKMTQVKPSDILDAVREYSSTRSVLDEATAIPIDLSLLEIEDIKAEIEKQGKIGSRQGIEIKATDGKGDELDVDDTTKGNEGADQGESETEKSKEKAENDYKGQFAMYYARILFFAFLTDSDIKSLAEVIKDIKKNQNNQRIANNLKIKTDILALFQKSLDPFILSDLDYKIQNINSLANDPKLKPEERAKNAFKKFGRLSASEIVTPEEVADKIIATIPENKVNNATKFLDIASKQGEFVYAIYKKYGKAVANNCYSIPTSKIAYEFTRKLYSLLDLDIANIEENYNSYDLIKKNQFVENDTLKINNTPMKFDVIVGNPPYQITKSGGKDMPIYHSFYDIASNLSPIYCLVSPARFLFDAGATKSEWNKKMLNDEHLRVVDFHQKSSALFPETDIKGGVAILFSDLSVNCGPIGVFTSHKEMSSILNKIAISNFTSIENLIYGVTSYTFSKALYHDHPNASERVGRGSGNQLTSSIFSALPEIFDLKKKAKSQIEIYGRRNNERVSMWVHKKYINLADNFNSYKILLPAANGSGAIGETLSTPVMGTPVMGTPVMGHTATFISIGNFENELHAKACLKYIKTKFCRTMLGIRKNTQHNKTKKVWKYVPLQNFTAQSDIDWSKSIPEIDAQLYKKYKLTKEEIAFIEGAIKPMT